MTTLDAFHLPGLGEEDVARWETLEVGDDVALRYPLLRPYGLSRLLETLAAARVRQLADRPVADIVRVIDETAAGLARETHPARQLAEAALPAVTGYSAPMVRLVLERMIADWSEPALRSLLEAELGDPRVLDGFRRQPGRGAGSVRAYGPELAFHIFAGNVPGVAVTSIVRSLLVKAATLGKTAAGDPLLPVLFARTLAEVDPDLGACLAVTYWPGGSEEVEAAAFAAADTVVVYGGADVVRDVRRRTGVGARLVVHGPRLSLALVGRDALAAAACDDTAAAAARACAIFDQQGCVSPHVLYVERGGDTPPERFAERVGTELARVQQELPRGRLQPAEAASIHHLRGAAEFRSLAGQDVRVHTGQGIEYTVIFDADPAFTASCLNRTVWVKPLDRVEDVLEHLEPFRAHVQTVGVIGLGGRLAGLAELLARAGVSRIAPLEAMPWPPPAWHHDGQEPLRELLRWADLEW